MIYRDVHSFWAESSLLVVTSLQVKQAPRASIEVLVPVGHAASHLAQLRVGVLHVVHELGVLLRVLGDLCQGHVLQDVLLKVVCSSPN